MEQENSLPRHILIIRISAIGDVAMLPHTIRAFSAEHPEVKLTVATQRFLRPFFRGLNVDFLDIDTTLVNFSHEVEYARYASVGTLRIEKYKIYI